MIFRDTLNKAQKQIVKQIKLLPTNTDFINLLQMFKICSRIKKIIWMKKKCQNCQSSNNERTSKNISVDSIYCTFKLIIFRNFSTAEVGELAYIWVHILCKQRTWEMITEYTHFFLCSQTCFLLTEKWCTVIELFELSVNVITWSLK